MELTCYHSVLTAKFSLKLERAWMECSVCFEKVEPEGLRMLYVQKDDENGQAYGRLQIFFKKGVNP